MNRRSFIGSILALGAAPAIVRADSLMRIVPRETMILSAVVPWKTYNRAVVFNEAWLVGEIGCYENFRFIISPEPTA